MTTGDGPEHRTARASGTADLASRLDELERTRSRDVEWRLREAQELARLAEPFGGEPSMRARLAIADMVHRTGDLAQGATLATRVLAWAEAESNTRVIARAHLVLSSINDAIGDRAASLDHAVRSVELLDGDAPPRDLAVHHLRLADALAVNNDAAEARARYRDAEALFRDCDDEEQVLTTLNNLTVLEYENGNTDAARAAAEQLLAGAAARWFNADYADTIARARLHAGDLIGAEAVVRMGMELLAGQGNSQASTPAELALTHVAVLRALGRQGEASRRLDACIEICTERKLDGILVGALEAKAELLAENGDFEAAYRTHREFHAASERHRSLRLDAAARARHALYETADARRKAAQFWLQARTDPLTGLCNRRYLDELLPVLLGGHARRSRCIVAGVLDLDHFKQINDAFSHGTGDDVLRKLAAVIERVIEIEVPERTSDVGSFAARLGGEEFLVVKVAPNVAEAVDAVERLRAEIERRSWDDVRPGLAVTVSIGVTRCLPDDTPSSLLTRADQRLYEAKHAGRNCVATDDGILAVSASGPDRGLLANRVSDGPRPR